MWGVCRQGKSGSYLNKEEARDTQEAACLSRSVCKEWVKTLRDMGGGSGLAKGKSSKTTIHLFSLKWYTSQVLVTHNYNPSYLGG
jgi:hypothetical protein